MSQSDSFIPPPPSEVPASPPPFALRMPVLLLFVAYWIALVVGTHLPRMPRVVDVHFFDKYLHFAAYAMLAFGLCLAWRMQRSRYASFTWRHYAAILSIMALYGAIDELTQPIFGRSCELSDWLADMAGALSGVTLFVVANALRRRWVGSSGGTRSRKFSPAN